MTDDRTRKAILARRARFLAAAMASAGMGTVGLAATLPGCSDDASETADAEPQVCLSPEPQDTGVCLAADAPPDTAEADAAADSDVDGAADAEPDAIDDAEDTGPSPCLKVAPDAGDDADTGPMPCLAPPLDGG